MNEILEGSILRIKINNTDIFLEDLGGNKGKITISDTYNHNYSYFWGAMGGTLNEFILSINSGYFADKLLGCKSNYVFDARLTFAAIRKFIASDLNLPWYKHIEFQKGLREKINEFQRDVESADQFVSGWHSFINSIDFYLIEKRYEREEVEKEFKNISEQWNFIGERLSPEYLWLEKLHGKLKKHLKTLKP